MFSDLLVKRNISNHFCFKKIKGKNQKGDENMKRASADFEPIDIGFILAHGTEISSQESMRDIVPVQWSQEVLDGKYKDIAIIRSKDE